MWDEDREDHDPRQADHAADAFGYSVIETYVPISQARLASMAEKEKEASAARKRSALRR